MVASTKNWTKYFYHFYTGLKTTAENAFPTRSQSIYRNSAKDFFIWVSSTNAEPFDEPTETRSGMEFGKKCTFEPVSEKRKV